MLQIQKGIYTIFRNNSFWVQDYFLTSFPEFLLKIVIFCFQDPRVVGNLFQLMFCNQKPLKVYMFYNRQFLIWHIVVMSNTLRMTIIFYVFCNYQILSIHIAQESHKCDLGHHRGERYLSDFYYLLFMYLYTDLSDILLGS